VLLIAKDSSIIIGTLMINFRKKGFLHYASHNNLAVASCYKGKGIASLLFQEALRIAKENNLDFINSFTATAAESSNRYHLKMGFVIYGKSFGKIRNSYSFIYPLRTYNFLRCLPVCKMVYIAYTIRSWIINQLSKI